MRYFIKLGNGYKIPTKRNGVIKYGFATWGLELAYEKDKSKFIRRKS